jgi:hypothetical protein
MKIKYLAVLMLVVVSVGMAQKPIVLPDLSVRTIREAYKDAVIAQQSFQAAQSLVEQSRQALNKAVADYHALEAVEAKKNGLPEGTTFTVDTVAGTVTPVLPKKDEPKK